MHLCESHRLIITLHFMHRSDVLRMLWVYYRCVIGVCLPGLGRPVMSNVIYGSSSSSGISNKANESSGGYAAAPLKA